jgi:hypothetical protein
MTPRRGLLVALLLLLVTACGAPGPGTTRTVDSQDVPYRLLDPADEDPAGASPGTGAEVTAPQVFLVDPERLLVADQVRVPVGDAASVTQSVLTVLAAGPSELQRARGLSTALAPDVQLRLVGLADGLASIALGPPDSAPLADRLPLAVGQVVLSATSVAGVDRVVLVQQGLPIEAPLPDGALTAEPLTASDYASLLAPGQRPTAKASPSP